MGDRRVTGAALPLLTLLMAGAALAIQAPINATLARATGNAVVAACANFLVGFLALALVCAVRGPWPSRGALSDAPAWAWGGGLLGATYIVALVWAVPQVGAVTAAAAAIFAQLVTALLLDRAGAFGLAVQEITWPRLAGVTLVFVGLLLSRL